MKSIIRAVLALILVGCATPPNPHAEAFRSYTAINKPRAEQGLMRWSDYYQGAYSIALSSRPMPPAAFLNGLSSMITAAQEFESGKITAQQFNAKRREAQIAAAREAQAQQQIATQGSDAALIGAGLQLMQMGAPRPVTTPRATVPMTTTCRSTAQVNGSVQTTCY